MGKPVFLRQENKRSVLVLYVVVIVLIAMSHTASWGEPGPGKEPPSQATTPSVGIPPDSNPTPLQTPSGVPNPEAVESFKRAQESLLRENFSYLPAGMLDPFVPFIAPATTAPTKPAESEASEEPEPVAEPEMQKPLTPLQRMSLGEIERGLKAITWGELGRRALIEDSAGKGYIVNIGTPAGDKNGIITQIFNDHLVIQQELWDRDLKRMVQQNSVVKLWKEKK